MKAVVAYDFGAPEDFMLGDLPDAPPGLGEVRVAVSVCGVSFVDSLTAAGRYQVRPPLPFAPGSEFAGIVESVGPDVTGIVPGDRVVGAALHGAFAERITVPAHALMRLPDGITLDRAVAGYIPQLTALHGLSGQAGLCAGEQLLVLGAAGAVGHAAVQIGALIGARVIAAASTAVKRTAAIDGGAAAAVDSSVEDFRRQVKAAVGADGVDVVFDTVGGALSEYAFRSLGWRGRHLVIGFADGSIPAIPANLPLLKEASLIGVNVGAAIHGEPQEIAALRSRLGAWWSEGALVAPVRHTYTLKDFAVAMRAASDRTGHGRILLSVA